MQFSRCEAMSETGSVRIELKSVIDLNNPLALLQSGGAVTAGFFVRHVLDGKSDAEIQQALSMLTKAFTGHTFDVKRITIPVSYLSDGKGNAVQVTRADGTTQVILPANTQYIGIPFASGLPAKPNAWGNFSDWLQGDNGSTYSMPLPIMKCAEGYFLRAEAKLRWPDVETESVQSLYEQGIRTSIKAEVTYRGAYVRPDAISSIDASAVDAYINGTGTQIDYEDPVAHADPSLLGSSDPTCNDREGLNDLCVAWDEGATDEQKLQRIITQKYIANFPLSVESWAECRRTGYPILFKGRVNESQNTNGFSGYAVDTQEGVRRVIYSSTCYDTNAAAMPGAIDILNSENTSQTGKTGDVGGTRVWWDNALEDNFSNDGN